MTDLYDRAHVESVLARVGMPKDRRDLILEDVRFPLELTELQALLAMHGVTHDGLIDRMGGSP